MPLKIALIGNPNSGKTTLFNILTGSNQTVGNWPGVTVEKKEGRLVDDRSVFICDLPGVYSLSPYTSEEVIVKQYFENERPDIILNIVDACSLERSLYLTTQILDFRIPTVIVLNMMDILEKQGKKIDTEILSDLLGCSVVKISAANKTGLQKLKNTIRLTINNSAVNLKFDTTTEKALNEIYKYTAANPANLARWYSIKLFERDFSAANKLGIKADALKKIDSIINTAEKAFQNSSENIIATQRYKMVEFIYNKCVVSNKNRQNTLTDKIDNIVTNKYLAFPIFICVLFLIYSLALGSFSQNASEFITNGLFGQGWFLFNIGAHEYERDLNSYTENTKIIEYFSKNDNGSLQFANIYIYDQNGKITKKIAATRQDYENALKSTLPDKSRYGIWIPGLKSSVQNLLSKTNCSDEINDLITYGIISGAGAVVGFLPQIFILFLCLSVLESCGYITRIAFITDRLFSRFGLTGKSFIPIIVGTGCGVPGVMASRTIESGRDKLITIATTTFMPCSAKLPLISLICSTFFKHRMLAAVSIYIISILSIILTALIFKSFKYLSASTSPFIMEMPSYHLPKLSAVLRDVRQKVISFLTRAGTVIVLASILIWLLSNYGISNNVLVKCEIDNSILAQIGKHIAPVFKPLGWGDWRFTVSAISGIIAKENTVSTLSILFKGHELSAVIQEILNANSAFSFMVFNVLCVPCIAAVATIYREINSFRYGTLIVCYQCCFAYLIAFAVYKLLFLTLPVMLIIIYYASKTKKAKHAP